MTEQAIPAWAVSHWEEMRRPDYLGKMDSGRQVQRLVSFIHKCIDDEQESAQQVVEHAQDQKRDATKKLRVRNQLVRDVRDILNGSDFQKVLQRQSRKKQAIVKMIGVKITEGIGTNGGGN